MDQSIRRAMAAAIAVVAGLPLRAGASATWNAIPSDSFWNTPNWTSGGNTAYTPVSGDGLIFNTSSVTHLNNDFSGFTFQPIGFLAPGAPYIIDGNSFTIVTELDQFAPQTVTFNTPITLSGTVNLGLDPGSTLVLHGALSGGTLSTSGGGTVFFGATNTYTGNTLLDGGTVSYTASNPGVKQLTFGFANKSINTTFVQLTADVTATSVLAQTNAGTASTISIFSGRTLTVNGGFTVGAVAGAADSGVNTVMNVIGDGTLAMNTGILGLTVGQSRADSATGTDPVASLDMHLLSNFTFTTANVGSIRVGCGGNVTGQLQLANVVNQISAGSIDVGNSSPNGGANAGQSGDAATLSLGGGSNVLNADRFNIGFGKQSGVTKFGGGTGSVSIAGKAGGSSVANIFVGAITGTIGPLSTASSFQLAGHTANVQCGSLVIGSQNFSGAGGAQNAIGSVTFDTGTFSVATLQLAAHSNGSGTSVTRGTFTLGGPSPNDTATGVLNVSNQFLMINRTATNGSAAAATFTINGGTANINTDILIIDNAIFGTRATTLTLAGGSLNMMGHAIATAALPINNVNMPTSGQTARLLNLGGTGINGQGLLMSGGGTLILGGNNTYSGSTSVTSGTLIVSNKIPNGPVQALGGRLQVAAKATPNDPSGTSVVPVLSLVGGTCDLTNNSMVIDYTTIGAQLESLRGGLHSGALTSTVATTTTRLGYGDNAVLGKTTFAGVSPDSSSILIKYTYAGDADLDGDADGVDIGTWATNFTGELGGAGTDVWTQGDWDYDGDVDGVDAGLWAQAFTGELGGGGLGSLVLTDPSISPGAASVLQGLGITVVPEPAAVTFLGVSFALLARRRRPGLLHNPLGEPEKHILQL